MNFNVLCSIDACVLIFAYVVVNLENFMDDHFQMEQILRQICHNMAYLAPSLHCELSMGLLKLNVKRAPYISDLFGNIIFGM